MTHIDPDLKAHIIKLYIQNGRSQQSLADEFGYSRSVISKWVRQYRANAEANEEKSKLLADMEELRRLKEENEELKKENDFLKKAAAFFAREGK
ncbi:MAG: transposase [Bacteroidaceae bacterium]|nr:transposase [Bacteroidaceae bacterium]